MAELRVIALALIAAGSAHADAPRPSAITPPAGWRALPKVASAVARGATADGVTVEASEAWGDPARGCFATSIALRGGGVATADQILASLAGTPVHDVAATAGSLALAFDHPPFHGRLRATLDGDRVSALACFGDRREPAACDAACATMIGVKP